MTLTKIKTDGITNDAVTKEKIPANQIEASELANDSVDTNAIQTDAVTTAKILDENITLAKLEHGTPSNDGKFLRANNGGDPTFETVSMPTAFDDNDILNDISTLALQVNSLQNATKFTSNSVFVDNFHDATGLSSFSNMERNPANHVQVLHNYSSEQYWTTTDLDSSHMIDYNMTAFTASKFVDGLTNSYAAYKDNATNYTCGFGYDIGADSDFGPKFILTGARFFNFATTARFSYFKFGYYNSNGATEISNGTAPTNFKVSPTDNAATSYVDNGGVRLVADNVNGNAGALLDVPYEVPTNTAAVLFTFTSEHRGPGQNDNAGVAEIEIKGKKFVSDNASGHFISNAITAPASTSSLGAVIIYKDHYGTTTINTDLKIYLSADNGSTFTQGTLTALPSYDAAGTKMAKVNDVTVTAGTQIKYKIEIANQASFSKEIHITGVSVQY